MCIEKEIIFIHFLFSLSSIFFPFFFITTLFYFRFDVYAISEDNFMKATWVIIIYIYAYVLVSNINGIYFIVINIYKYILSIGINVTNVAWFRIYIYVCINMTVYFMSHLHCQWKWVLQISSTLKHACIYIGKHEWKLYV